MKIHFRAFSIINIFFSLMFTASSWAGGPHITSNSDPMFGTAIARSDVLHAYAFLDEMLIRFNKALGEYAREMHGDRATRQEFSEIHFSIEEAPEFNAATQVYRTVKEGTDERAPLVIGFTINMILGLAAADGEEKICRTQGELQLTKEQCWAVLCAAVLAHEIGHHVDEWIGTSRLRTGAERSKQGKEANADYAGARLLELAGYPMEAMYWLNLRMEQLETQRSGKHTSLTKRMSSAFSSSHPRNALRSLSQELGLTVRRYRGSKMAIPLRLPFTPAAATSLEELRLWKKNQIHLPYSSENWVEALKKLRDAITRYYILQTHVPYELRTFEQAAEIKEAQRKAHKTISVVQEFIDNHASHFTTVDVRAYIDVLGLSSTEAEAEEGKTKQNKDQHEWIRIFMMPHKRETADHYMVNMHTLPRPTFLGTAVYQHAVYQTWLKEDPNAFGAAYLRRPEDIFTHSKSEILRQLTAEISLYSNLPVPYSEWARTYFNDAAQKFENASIISKYEMTSIWGWEDFGFISINSPATTVLRTNVKPGIHDNDGVALRAIHAALPRGEVHAFKSIAQMVWRQRGLFAFFDLLGATEKRLDWDWIFTILEIEKEEGLRQLSTSFLEWAKSNKYTETLNSLNTEPAGMSAYLLDETDDSDDAINVLKHTTQRDTGADLFSHYEWVTEEHIVALSRVEGALKAAFQSRIIPRLRLRIRKVFLQNFQEELTKRLRIPANANTIQVRTAFLNAWQQATDLLLTKGSCKLAFVDRLRIVESLPRSRMSNEVKSFVLRNFVKGNVQQPPDDLSMVEYVKLVNYGLEQGYLALDITLFQQIFMAYKTPIFEVVASSGPVILSWLDNLAGMQTSELLKLMSWILPQQKTGHYLSRSDLEGPLRSIILKFATSLRDPKRHLTLDQAIGAFERLSSIVATAEADAFYKDILKPLAHNEYHTTNANNPILIWSQERRWRDPEIAVQETIHYFNNRINLLEGRPSIRFDILNSLLKDMEPSIYGSALVRDQFYENIAKRLLLRDGWQLRMIERFKVNPLRRSRAGTVESLSAFAEISDELMEDERTEMIEWLKQSGHAALPGNLKASFIAIFAKESNGYEKFYSQTYKNDSEARAHDLASSLLLASPEERVPLLGLLLRTGMSPLNLRPDFIQYCARIFLKHQPGSFHEKVIEAFFEVIPESQRVTTMAYLIAQSGETRGSSIRSMFEVFTSVGVKAGQLSAILNIFGLEISMELRELKDRALAMTRDEIFEFLNDPRFVPTEVRQKIDNVGEILGSASIKTVFEVIMKDGSRHVMMIQRPEAAQMFRDNLDLARRFIAALEAKGIENFPAGFLKNILDSLEKSAHKELNFIEEGLAIGMAQQVYGKLNETLSTELENWKFIVPELLPQFKAGRHYLITDRAYGVRFDELEESFQKQVGRYIVEASLTAFFKYGWICPDRHKGNFLIDTTEKKIYAYDFGQGLLIDGSLPEELAGETEELSNRYNLARFAQSLFAQDVQGVLFYGAKLSIFKDRSKVPDILKANLLNALREGFKTILPPDERIKSILQIFVDAEVPLEHQFSFGVLKGLLTLAGENYVSQVEFSAMLASHISPLLDKSQDQITKDEHEYIPEIILSTRFQSGQSKEELRHFAATSGNVATSPTLTNATPPSAAADQLRSTDTNRSIPTTQTSARRRVLHPPQTPGDDINDIDVRKIIDGALEKAMTTANTRPPRALQRAAQILGQSNTYDLGLTIAVIRALPKTSPTIRSRLLMYLQNIFTVANEQRQHRINEVSERLNAELYSDNPPDTRLWQWLQTGFNSADTQLNLDGLVSGCEALLKGLDPRTALHQ